MATVKDPVLVVLQLSGANDYLHTIVPYNNPYYRDARPNLGLSEDVVPAHRRQVCLQPQPGAHQGALR